MDGGGAAAVTSNPCLPNAELEFFPAQNTFASCRSTNFIAKPANATAKSSSAPPTGAARSARIAVRPSWTRNFPPSRQRVAGGIQGLVELVPPGKNPAVTVAAAAARAIEFLVAVFALRKPRDWSGFF